MNDSISHFAYEHPLWPVYVYPDSPEECHICQDKIRGDAYSSKKASSETKPGFIIHERCAKLPKEVTHPFHSHHPLILQKQSIQFFLSTQSRPSYTCKMCRAYSSFIYLCSECDFCVDIKCAALIPPKDLQSLSNPYSSIPLKGPNHFQYLCRVCYNLIDGGVVYFNPNSCSLLHESCANLPEEIDHPFHPSHPLTLLPQETSNYMRESFMCYACGKTPMDQHYCCSECEFYLDVNCAFLVLATKNYEPPHDGFTHQHPLIQCDQSRSVIISCSSCGHLCKGSVYVCIECHFVLDESCLTLPSYLQHPFHWRHPLILYESSHRNSFECNACGFARLSVGYACLDCSFVIHTTCGWPVPLTINSKLHQHPLAFLEKENEKFSHDQLHLTFLKKPNEKFPCYYCRRNCTAPFFCCLQCEYYVHLRCLPQLPRVVKHKRHIHSLSLTDSPIKDDSDEDEEAELYCNACETRRRLVDPTYYCADCHFVAHIHCCMDEILRHLEISSTKTISQEGITKSSTANATKDAENQAASAYTIADGKIMFVELKSEIAGLEEKIKERRKEIDELEKKLQSKVGRARFIASVCNLQYF